MFLGSKRKAERKKEKGKGKKYILFGTLYSKL
jgi:hypothetical protein